MNEDYIIAKALEICSKHKFNGTYFLFVDFTRPANQHRLFLVDVRNKSIVYSSYTSHGSGSGPKSGKNLQFSNVPNSRMSSKGLMRAAESYRGKFGYSCRLDGLEPGINDNVRRRAIVVHPSWYSDDTFVRDNGYPGRSWGCIGLDPDDSKYIIDCIKDGSYVYIEG